MKSALSNSYNLLAKENRLTIGYFGGSITCGGCVQTVIKNGQKVPNEKESILKSYVNQTSAWIGELFPNAKIETVNSGVSGTHSQMGLYRLEGSLMNCQDHAMPNLVFIEFTSNDWVYGEHTVEIIKAEVESLIINIRKINPFADIVIIATNTMDLQNLPKKQAHKDIADHYGLPFIDVGLALQKAKNHDPQSAPTESAENRTLKYTIDNLHPSAEGYAVYMEEIKKVLTEHLCAENCEKDYVNHAVSAPAPLSKELYNPKFIPISELCIDGEFELKAEPLTVPMHATLTYELCQYPMSQNYAVIPKGQTVTANFNGSILGILVNMQRKINLELRYSIDGGEWQAFNINDSCLGFERYPHTQAYFLKAGLSDDKHTVALKSVSETPFLLGGLLAQK